jgi:hypothetical protein
MYSASIPMFKAMLANLDSFLTKAEGAAAAKKFDVNNFMTERLAPDMLPFSRQIQIACDAAKNGVARLSGGEAPKFEDNEASFEQLHARISKTVAYLDTIKPGQMNGTEDKEITFPVGREATKTMKGEAYLKHWVFPNFYFHVTMVYALLRAGGVDLGKGDYLMGGQPK